MLGLLAASGCASTGGPAKPAPPEPHVNPMRGQVVRINPESRYVVLECTVLPSEGEVITLYGVDRTSSRVRVTAQRTGRFVVADIMDGWPAQGDGFRGDGTTNNQQQRR